MKNRRTSDADYPEFYTLNSGGMINAFLENMEQINKNTGEKEASPGADTIAGKVLFPNSGFGRPAWWNFDIMVARLPMPSLPDLTPKPPEKPKIPGADNMIPWTPDIPSRFPTYPRPDIDPGFHPGFHTPGTPIWGDFSLMSAGYNDPNYGLPSDGGGAFVGTGATPSCIMPSPMQPSTPVGGLFGPDSYAPFWGNPGYNAPENMSNPGIFLPYMPAPIPPDAFSMLGGNVLSGAPGTRPSIGLSSVGGEVVVSYSEALAGVRGRINRERQRIFRKYGTNGIFINIAVTEQYSAAEIPPGTDPLLAAILRGDIAVSGKKGMPPFGYTTKGARKVEAANRRLRAQHAQNRANAAGMSAAEKEALVQERVRNATVHEYYEGEWREIPQGTDLAKYFASQRRSANWEAAWIASKLLVEVILTILTGGSNYLIGRYLITRIAKWADRYFGEYKVWIKGYAEAKGIPKAVVHLTGRAHADMPTPHTHAYKWHERAGIGGYKEHTFLSSWGDIIIALLQLLI